MIHNLKYIVLQVNIPIVRFPVSDLETLFKEIDLLIFGYKGMYYGIPKHELDNWSGLAFDTTARVKYNPKRGRTDPIITFDLARLPTIPSILISEAFLSGSKLAYNFDDFRKRNTKPDPDPQKNP